VAETGKPPSFSKEELEEFSFLEPIDIYDPIYTSMLQELHLHILDIVDLSDNGDPEQTNLDK
jgi:hypothetical protein